MVKAKRTKRLSRSGRPVGHVETDYLFDVFSTRELAATVRWCVKRVLALRAKHRFDSIAFTGISGAAVAFAVSAATGIPITCVRKRSSGSEASHSSCAVEGHVNMERYIIIDDFVDTGATLERVRGAISKAAERWDHDPELVGVVLYTGARCRIPTVCRVTGLARSRVVVRYAL